MGRRGKPLLQRSHGPSGAAGENQVRCAFSLALEFLPGVDKGQQALAGLEGTEVENVGAPFREVAPGETRLDIRSPRTPDYGTSL